MTDSVAEEIEISTLASVAREPDGHGQAALLLVETLIHLLVERSVISIDDAVETVETAIEVKEDTGPELGDSPAALAKSLALLSAIGASLRHDLPVK